MLSSFDLLLLLALRKRMTKLRRKKRCIDNIVHTWWTTVLSTDEYRVQSAELKMTHKMAASVVISDVIAAAAQVRAGSNVQKADTKRPEVGPKSFIMFPINHTYPRPRNYIYATDHNDVTKLLRTYDDDD